MKFSVVVHGSPANSQANYQALRFCQSVISTGHELYRVFFYGDAVYTGIEAVYPQNEMDMVAEWKKLKHDNDTDLVVCIAAALKRGAVDKTERDRHNLSADTLSEEFELSGLGQLIDATQHSDRVITFK